MGLKPMACGHDWYTMEATGKPRQRKPRPVITLGSGWRVVIEVRASKASIWLHQEILVDAGHYAQAAHLAQRYCIERERWQTRAVLFCQEIGG